MAGRPPFSDVDEGTNGDRRADPEIAAARVRRPRVWAYFLAAAGLVILIAFAMGGALIGMDRRSTAARDQTFAVAGAPRLLVNMNVGGSIRVQPGNDNAVHVHADLRGSNRIDFSVSQSGDAVDVDVHPSGWLSWLGGARKATITVTMPRRSTVELDAANSRIDVQGIDGNLTLHSSNGALQIADVNGPLDASTSNGSIQVSRVNGKMMLRTSNGSIRLIDVSGSFSAQTSNGSITFSGTPAAQSTNLLRTSNGSVSVTLEGTPSVNVDATATNGRVSTTLPITTTGTGSTHLSGTIGAGEATLLLQTSNGSIMIQ